MILMPGERLLLLLAFFCFLFLFSNPSFANGSVILYKFSSFASSGDWIEIKNVSDQNFDLGNLIIEDKAGNKKENFDCYLAPGGIYNISFSNYLNRDDEVIFLKNNLGEILDCLAYGNETCVEGNPADLVIAPREGKYGFWDGQGWDTTSDGTKSDNSSCLVPTPIPSPVPTSVPTPSPTLEPLKGTYQINEVKDESNNFLSNVKIYLDDVYIHHYCPEVLTFCSGCYCDDDKQAACEFGDHQIRLEKSGYQDWEILVTINSGDNFSVNPQMASDQESSFPTSTPTPTPTPTEKPSNTPTPKLSPTLGLSPALEEDFSLNATDSGEVLGNFGEATLSGEGKNLSQIIAGSLVVLGGGLVASTFGLSKIKKYFDKIKEDEKEV